MTGRYRSRDVRSERVIGVDLGGTKILAGHVTRDGVIGRTIEIATPAGDQDAVLAACDGVVQDLLADGADAVGYGVPLNIDRRTGVALRAVNLPLHDVNFPNRAREQFGLPAGVENDANAAALAEWRHGAGRGVSNLVMYTLGTGVGGGVVIDGGLYRGWAELGHMVIVEDGEPCQGACSGRGHVESYCSGTAADRRARELLGPEADARDLVAQQHPVLQEIGHHLGVAIGSLVNIFGPTRVVIGGGFGIGAFDLLVPAARTAVLREALAPGGQTLEIARAELGAEAGLIGAGLIAHESLR
jgi:glucokinase